VDDLQADRGEQVHAAVVERLLGGDRLNMSGNCGGAAFWKSSAAGAT
jgi:hypothetical protein